MNTVGQSTWREIRQMRAGGKKRWRRYHRQAFDAVCPDAQRRIAQLGHDEQFEELWRFRIDQKKRLWGYEVDGVFYLLWWDKDHKVCPTEPGNT